VNIFAVRGVQIRNSSSLVQHSAKFIPKQLLQNKQKTLGFLSYASFHFSYSTKLFLHFMWSLLK